MTVKEYFERHRKKHWWDTPLAYLLTAFCLVLPERVEKWLFESILHPNPIRHFLSCCCCSNLFKTEDSDP